MMIDELRSLTWGDAGLILAVAFFVVSIICSLAFWVLVL